MVEDVINLCFTINIALQMLSLFDCQLLIPIVKIWVSQFFRNSRLSLTKSLNHESALNVLVLLSNIISFSLVHWLLTQSLTLNLTSSESHTFLIDQKGTTENNWRQLGDNFVATVGLLEGNFETSLRQVWNITPIYTGAPGSLVSLQRSWLLLGGWSN